MADLHVYFFDITNEWFVAESALAAQALWRDQNELPTGEDEDADPLTCTQCPDDELFEMSPDGGDTFDEKTFAEWAKESGPGWFAGEL